MSKYFIRITSQS